MESSLDPAGSKNERFESSDMLAVIIPFEFSGIPVPHGVIPQKDVCWLQRFKYT
jgi:hypothetical protein